MDNGRGAVSIAMSILVSMGVDRAPYRARSAFPRNLPVPNQGASRQISSICEDATRQNEGMRRARRGLSMWLEEYLFHHIHYIRRHA
jgi:hypothetical protein